MNGGERLHRAGAAPFRTTREGAVPLVVQAGRGFGDLLNAAEPLTTGCQRPELAGSVFLAA